MISFSYGGHHSFAISSFRGTKRKTSYLGSKCSCKGKNMGVACLAQVEIPEGKGAQQVLEALQRKVELAGAVRSGNWSVDCETYYSTQNTETTAKTFHLLHCSDYPNLSFTALENDTCVVAEQGMDSLILQVKAFYAPRKSGKIEAKGIKYDFGDFKIRLGNIAQGNNFRGIIVEFEYCACFDVTQSWELMLELVYSFIEEQHCQVLAPPKTVSDTKTKRYSVADKMLQYAELFKFGKKS